MKRKWILIALAAAVTVAAGAGCRKNDTASNDEIKASIPDTYPIDTDVTLRWWTGTPVKDGDMFADYLEEATGVRVSWEYPANSSDAATAFNLMIASDDLPDIILSGWANSHGGPDYNLQKNIIADLTPYLENGIAPNLKKYIDEHSDLKKMMTSGEGKYYYFPQLLGDERLASFRTWFIREDLLKKAGM